MIDDLFINNPTLRAPRYQLPDTPLPKTLHSMSCGMGARDFFNLVRSNEITAIMDTRLTRRYRGFGFATLEDDFYFLCELAGAEYYDGDILAPTDALRKTFHREFTEPKTSALRNQNAWTEYLFGYEVLLQKRKPLQFGTLHDLLYNTDHTSIAVVCSCAHHDDCHRSYACGIVSRYIRNVTLSILYPNDCPPKKKSPRRYRNQDFVYANLPRNNRRGRG